MEPTKITTAELRDGIAALTFYDIAKLARVVKGASLGMDINRKFVRSEGSAPIKVQFADWCMEHLDHAELARELPTWEKSSRRAYEAKGRKQQAEVLARKEAALGLNPVVIEDVPRPTRNKQSEREFLRDAFKGTGIDTWFSGEKETTPPASDNAPAADAASPKDLDEALRAVLAAANDMDEARASTARKHADTNINAAVTMLEKQIKEMEARTARDLRITVRQRDDSITTTTLGRQHISFDTLLKLTALRDSSGYALNIWLTGPAGSGKTTAARNAAKALQTPFYFTGAIADEFKLLGFIDARGHTVRTAFRDAWEHGGVFLFDEIDGSAPGALLALNAALANGTCDFPDGNVVRHADCVMVAAANTWGGGATHDYVGRAKLDAASVDRFVQLAWEYDEALERDTCGNAAWAAVVQAIRSRVNAAGIKVVVSPRASYNGAVMLAEGFTQTQVLTMTVRKGMTDDQWRQVKGSH